VAVCKKCGREARCEVLKEHGKTASTKTNRIGTVARQLLV